MRYGTTLEQARDAAGGWLCPHCYEADHPKQVQCLGHVYYRRRLSQMLLSRFLECDCLVWGTEISVPTHSARKSICPTKPCIAAGHWLRAAMLHRHSACMFSLVQSVLMHVVGAPQGWICNSSICMTRRGMKPTGIAIFDAQVHHIDYSRSAGGPAIRNSCMATQGIGPQIIPVQECPALHVQPCINVLAHLRVLLLVRQ